MAKERYLYLDMLRGITMILVIYSHINVFCSHTIGMTPFNKFCVHFRMPLFFLISGFLAYSQNYNLRLLCKRVSNRVVRQLLPTIIILIPISFMCGKGYFNVLLSNDKLGYWFTIALFEVFCLFSIITWIGHFGGQKLLTILYLCIISISIFAIFYTTTYWTTEWKNKWVKLCSLSVLIYRIPYFFYGALLRMYFNEITSYIFRPLVMSIVLLAYILLYYFQPPWCMLYSTPLLLLVIIYPFYLGGNQLAMTKIGTALSYFGKNTLQIYLLHYFIIYTLRDTKIITPLVDSLSHWYIEVPVLFSLSVIIASCCMLVDKLLEKIKLKQFIFPSKVPQFKLHTANFFLK